MKLPFLSVACCLLCLVAHAQRPPVTHLRFLGEYALPRIMAYNNTSVGGLSGIDYDAASGLYYLISDDRSAINPARFYTARIGTSQKGIDTVAFTSVVTLQQPDGSAYPSLQKDVTKTPDPEAIRYNPRTQQLVWTSEGERIVRGDAATLVNPGLFIIQPDGRYIDTFPLPANLVMQATEQGPRQNGVLEGLSFTNDYRTLFTNVEEPLYEDGPRAGLKANGAFIRLYKFDVATRQNTAQYAYELSPVVRAPIPADTFKMNGAADILAIDSTHLLVLERSFSAGTIGFSIRIYLADLTHAENIISNTSLKATPTARPARKQLLLDMNALHIYTDNIEGMTFGPKLPNGHATLVCVADNNFKFYEKPQFLLFELY